MRNNERIKSIAVLCLFLLGKMFFFVLNSRWKRSALWLIIGFSLLAVFNLYNGTSTKQIPEVNYSEFVIQVENGQVADTFIRGDHVMRRFLDGHTYTTFLPAKYPSIIQNLVKNHARIKIGCRGSLCIYW
jgi:cell division protease FtsH